jgi:MoaA/NifB/PqqE/SkfB family radical SAM enzyme
MNASNTLKKFGLEKLYDQVLKDPDKNLPKIMDWVDKFAGDDFIRQRKDVRDALTNPDNAYYHFIRRMINEIDPGVMKTLITNFFINAVLTGWKKQEKLRAEMNCNIPWAILMDPTSACNLHCTGCWAAEYGNKLNLTYDELDDIICQGKELGVYLYIYTGGEPLVRKKDIIRLCEKHDDCVFLSFTNGTLIDDEFTDEMLRVKNFIPAISLEGFEKATDARRGEGVFQATQRAMKLMHEKKLPYGVSTCYTRANFDSIISEEYYDGLVSMDAFFIWFFHYMPVGMDAVPELLPTPEQRRLAYKKIRGFRATKPLFAMDFQNDGEYVGGCIAGGKRYLHINANGDVDPCVFVHYSDSNIRQKTLLECLQSPLLMAYHDNMPFNDNMLRPCPMLENPEKIRDMVKATGAKSTDLQAPEDVDHLYGKCMPYATNWKPMADKLWAESAETRAERAKRSEA